MNNKPQHPELNLNDLHILHLINHHQNITAAATAINLTQSALSRRLQNIENELGIKLFERTTRKLKTTTAGKQLLRDTMAIPNILNSAIQRISEDYLGTQKQIKIGISPSLSLAHLPGIFHKQTSLNSEIKTIISQPSTQEIIHQVITNRIDLGIVTEQPQLRDTCNILHQMQDRFCIITPASVDLPSMKPSHFKKWALQQSWILPPTTSPSRMIIDQWMQHFGLQISPTMELENFDLMCQLTALSTGIAFIPKRALTAFPRKKQLQHITLHQAPERTLVVISPKNTIIPEHITRFTNSILFS